MLNKISIKDLHSLNNKALVFQDCHYDTGLQTSKSATESWNRIFKDQIHFIYSDNYIEDILTIDRNDKNKRQDVVIIFNTLKKLNKKVYNEEMYYLKSVKRYLSQFE